MAEKTPPNRANQGLDVKVFSRVLLAALILFILGIIAFVAMRGPKAIPKANEPHPNSRLVQPGSGTPVG